MLAITVCATKSYTYAMRAQARRVVANVVAAKIAAGQVIIVGDKSPEVRDIAKAYEVLLPEGWKVVRIEDDLREDGPNYQEKAQLLIARARETAFAWCRKIGATLVWSLDSDVLPPANALRCMMTMLQFDGGYYSVSTCPYPNAAWLGGFGDPQHPIAEDFLPHERKLPWKLKRAYDECERRLKGERKPSWHHYTRQYGPSEEQMAKRPWSWAHWGAEEYTYRNPNHQRNKAAAIEREQKRMERLREKVKAYPPDGNVFQVNGKHGWRRRGWLEHAYPGIGRGAVVPSDWCGFGCTLINEQALALASFEGYDGKGTEDLFVVWHRWYPAGLRINVITHCPCDHVIWEKKKGGDEKAYTHLIAYHETEGEYRGHLRTRPKPWTPERAERAA